MKRITETVSFWNGFCVPFPIHFDFYSKTTFVLHLVKVWNAENPFKQITFKKNLRWYEG